MILQYNIYVEGFRVMKYKQIIKRIYIWESIACYQRTVLYCKVHNE